MTVQKLASLRLTTAGFMGLFLHGIIVAAPGAFLPQWTATFGETVNIGLFYTAFLPSSLVGLVLASRRVERHPWFALAFVTVTVAFALICLSPTFIWIGLAALLIGFGDGILNLQCNSLVGELHPQRRIVLLNWANATFGLGALSAPLMGTFLPWRLACGLVAILALGSVALAWRAPHVLNYQPQRDRMPWKQATPFLVVIFLYVGLESAIGTWSGAYLRSLGESVVWSGTLLSLYWGGLTVGRLTLSIWVNPQPIRRLQWLLLAGLVVVSLTSVFPLGILFAVAAFLYGPTFATVFALVQHKCGHVAIGYLFYAAYLGKTSVPALLGQIGNPAYFPYGFITLALLLYGMSRKISVPSLTYSD
ncbi:MAG: MFS transporter [Coleofasciculus sp. B1-GNL1-01]|uniref:MFS transporter n=1 Tax=Coleofasciculus sp. B1-GNL1-01 TaxID=3068484 RepID=UPI00330390A9